MTCKEVNKKSYQTRKSPAFHAKDCKGLSMKGKDGLYISKPDVKGVYKWVKSSKTKKVKGKFYDIHDNGGRPFRVFIAAPYSRSVRSCIKFRGPVRPIL